MTHNRLSMGMAAKTSCREARINHSSSVDDRGAAAAVIVTVVIIL